MRRRIATVLSVGLIATPAAIALAAEQETNETRTGAPAGATAAKPRDGLLSLARVNLRRERAEERRERRARRLEKSGESAPAPAQGGSTASPQLEAIAACESGGNPSAIGGGGQFRGKYQFTYETWAGVGGSGDPAAAPEAEQDRRAAILLAQAGTSPWPVCGG